MKTVVYQYFQAVRTSGIPPWIERCMQSVQAWAAQRGYDYLFIDTYAPYVSPQEAEDAEVIEAISDLLRLHAARDLLAQGYQRVIWFDADVLVFDPAPLSIPVTEEFAFCEEVWVDQKGERELAARRSLAWGVAVFVEGNSALDFLAYALKTIMRQKPPRRTTPLFSVNFLSYLHQYVPMPLLYDIGSFSPAVLRALATEQHALLRAYMRLVGRPLRAANMAFAVSDISYQGISITTEMQAALVDTLMERQGHILNQYAPISETEQE
jgi:hypothetical protein